MNIIKKITSYKVIASIQLFASILLTAMLLILNAFPTMFIVLIVAFLAFILLASFIIQYKAKENSIRSIIAKLLCIVMAILLFIASFAVYVGNHTLSVNTGAETQTDVMEVIVAKDSSYQVLNDLTGKFIYANGSVDEDNLTSAYYDIKNQIDFYYDDTSNFEAMVTNVQNQAYDAILVNEAYRGILEDLDEDFTDNTRIIYTFKITSDTEDLSSSLTISSGVFNVYISGIDVAGDITTKSRSDVNMLLTINLNTHQILMTSIPRDYYVTLHTFKAKDKLTHSGIYGIDETVQTVEDFMDTDIAYYFRVNFTTLVTLVDALGGIDVYSDKTLSDSIKEGWNHMDGETALAFSRERHAYGSGDRHRVQNQQAVLTAIIKKMVSTTMITNYTKVMKSIQGCFETNMKESDITSLVKMQLAVGTGWNFIHQSVDGKGKLTYGCYSMPKSKLYVMVPDEDTIESCHDKIFQMIQGKEIKQE